MKYFTTTHEWFEDSTGEVGISDYGIKEMGDVVYVGLPSLSSVSIGSAVCVVESTKAATDINSPVSGTITEVNSSLLNDPGQLNQPGGIWLYKIQPSNPAEFSSLQSQEAYDKLTRG